MNTLCIPRLEKERGNGSEKGEGRGKLDQQRQSRCGTKLSSLLFLQLLLLRSTPHPEATKCHDDRTVISSLTPNIAKRIDYFEKNHDSRFPFLGISPALLFSSLEVGS